MRKSEDDRLCLISVHLCSSVVNSAVLFYFAAMSQTLRWGILGTGNIAKQFAAGVRQSARCRSAAVASRAIDSARDFARNYEITSAYGSYDAMLADKAVDAVYLSLPNSLHQEWTIKSLRAG